MYALHGIVGYPAIPRINKVKYFAIPYNTLRYPTIPCDITNYIFQLHIFHFLFDCGVVRNGGGKDGGGVVTVRHWLYNDDDDGDDDDG